MVGSPIDQSESSDKSIKYIVTPLLRHKRMTMGLSDVKSKNNLGIPFEKGEYDSLGKRLLRKQTKEKSLKERDREGKVLARDRRKYGPRRTKSYDERIIETIKFNYDQRVTIFFFFEREPEGERLIFFYCLLQISEDLKKHWEKIQTHNKNKQSIQQLLQEQQQQEQQQQEQQPQQQQQQQLQQTENSVSSSSDDEEIFEAEIFELKEDKKPKKMSENFKDRRYSHFGSFSSMISGLGDKMKTKPETPANLGTPKGDMPLPINSNLEVTNIVDNISEKSLESQSSLISSTSIKEDLRRKKKDSLNKQDEEAQSEISQKEKTAIANRNSTAMQSLTSHTGNNLYTSLYK
jgi:hypothetical protein